MKLKQNKYIHLFVLPKHGTSNLLPFVKTNKNQTFKFTFTKKYYCTAVVKEMKSLNSGQGTENTGPGR